MTPPTPRHDRTSPLAALVADVRAGIRRLLRRPGVSLLAGGTLALGLATSTAVFAYRNAYDRPFPGADADDLYRVFLSSAEVPYGPLSWPDFQDLRSAMEDVLDIAGIGVGTFGASVRHETLTEVAFGQAVTGDYFRLLDVDMAAGRGLAPGDDDPAAAPVTVLSHAYWMRRYAGDDAAIGRTILLNNRPYTIVGVAGPAFLGSDAEVRPQFWLPFEAYAEVYWARSERRSDRTSGVVLPYVRRKAATPATRARAALGTLAMNLDRDAALPDRTRRFLLEPATWIGPASRNAEQPTNRVMTLAAAFLLVLTCANVANVIVAAGTRRHEEMALRAALGASRGTLVRQLVWEHVLLSTLAGGLAILAAKPLAARLSAWFARPSVWGTNVAREIPIDPHVILFALAIAVATGVLTGLVPAFRVSNRDPAGVLRRARRISDGSRAPSGRLPDARDVLVSVQIALCVVLLSLAGLVVRTLEAASDVDAGFDTSTTVATYISTSSMGTPIEERHAFFRDLARRFEQLPWVRAVAVSEYAPLSPHPDADLRVDGTSETVHATVARVFPGYFEALGMQLLHGRTLQPNDTAGPDVATVINASLARRLTADGRAEGLRLWLPGAAQEPDRPFRIVGVVRDARVTGILDDPGPVVYPSLGQLYSPPGNALVISVRGRPAASIGRIEDALRTVDTRLAIVNILPYREVVAGFLYTQRMNAELFSVFALLGLVLAAAGVFAVVALAVARRSREIGIRMAIGADRGAIVRLVARAIATPVVLGIAIGLAGALLSSRVVESLTWGVEPIDPISLASSVAVLLISIVLAIAVPTGRAIRVDPVTTLRAD